MQKSELLREKKRLLCLTPLHYAINKVKDERGRVRRECARSSEEGSQSSCVLF